MFTRDSGTLQEAAVGIQWQAQHRAQGLESWLWGSASLPSAVASHIPARPHQPGAWPSCHLPSRPASCSPLCQHFQGQPEDLEKWSCLLPRPDTPFTELAFLGKMTEPGERKKRDKESEFPSLKALPWVR